MVVKVVLTHFYSTLKMHSQAPYETNIFRGISQIQNSKNISYILIIILTEVKVSGTLSVSKILSIVNLELEPLKCW